MKLKNSVLMLRCVWKPFLGTALFLFLDVCFNNSTILFSPERAILIRKNFQEAPEHRCRDFFFSSTFECTRKTSANSADQVMTFGTSCRLMGVGSRDAMTRAGMTL